MHTYIHTYIHIEDEEEEPGDILQAEIFDIESGLRFRVQGSGFRV
jgi:hypothetical protein